MSFSSFTPRARAARPSTFEIGKHIAPSKSAAAFDAALFRRAWSVQAAIDVAAGAIDKYLTWGEPPQRLPRRSRLCLHVRSTGAEIHLRHSLTCPSCANTNDEAQKAADGRLFAMSCDGNSSLPRSRFLRRARIWSPAKRMAELHHGRPDN